MLTGLWAGSCAKTAQIHGGREAPRPSHPRELRASKHSALHDVLKSAGRCSWRWEAGYRRLAMGGWRREAGYGRRSDGSSDGRRSVAGDGGEEGWATGGEEGCGQMGARRGGNRMR